MNTPRTLGVIVARGGSKRVPRKVLRPLAGYPLIAYGLRAALASRLDRVVVSSEDAEIRAVAEQYGGDAPFERPMELASDFARNDAVILHALDAVAALDPASRYDIVVLIQPTAPFIKADDIDACVSLLREGDANCVFAGRAVREPPEWMFTAKANGPEVSRLFDGALVGDQQHTQKLAQYLIPAGAIWALRADVLREHEAVYVPPYRCHKLPAERAVDLDEEIDFMVAEALAKRHGFSLTDLPARESKSIGA